MTVFFIVFFGINALLLLSAVRVVPQGFTGSHERAGIKLRDLQPGLHIVLPFIDKVRLERS